MALSPEEEKLRSKLENMQALVSAPTQYKGLLSELLSQMRMQRNQWNLANPVDYALEPGQFRHALIRRKNDDAHNFGFYSRLIFRYVRTFQIPLKK